MSRLPRNLLGNVMLIPSDPSDPDSEPVSDAVNVVIFRWDRYDYLGWIESFIIVLNFPGERVYEVEIPPSTELVDGHSVRVEIDTDTILRERPQQSDRLIPRIIFNLSTPLNRQPSPQIRRLLKNVRRTTELMHCTALYLVIEDEAGKREVENSGITNFKEAYDAVLSGSYKADLLRYYLLYKYGGVYLDDKSLMRYSLDSKPFDTIFGGGTDMFIGFAKLPEIAFMSARRESPIMLKALETAIENIMQRAYTNHVLGITGNYMFHQTLKSDVHGPLHDHDLQPNINRQIYWGENTTLLPITKSNELILWDDDILWQRRAITNCDWPKRSNYYANLWSRREVYIDGNPPPPIFSMSLNIDTRREIFAYVITIMAIIGFGIIIAQYPPINWI